MNERIRLHAQEAGFKVDWQHEDVQAIKMARFEKFAELIVQEAADYIDKREWVGLTDEERADCWSSSAVESAIKIEQALRKKNT